ncbi:hypothetical protein [Ephemeroptericola cinctiostellae]|nr:hypothetical protein [Ephemeroptericola cinctiostellae]
MVFGLIALMYVELAVVGVSKAYTPVPYSDMWTGYLGFYEAVRQGDLGAWWGQHNEHRIVLSRMLFWLDIAVFGGQSWFLLVVNYALVCCTTGLFYLFLRGLLGEKHDRELRWVLFGACVAVLFAWSQEENLTWGFQSQLFLAQLLPLAAFYFMHRSVAVEARSGRYFLLAVLCGIAAVGSMINGVLVLPLMLVYSLWMRMGAAKSVVLFVLAALCVCGYFYGHVSPVDRVPVVQLLGVMPLAVGRYVLTFFGGLFFYMGLPWVGVATSLWLAFAGGVMFVVLALTAMCRCLRSLDARHASLYVALLVYVLYFVSSVLGGFVGRASFDVAQAVNSHHQTSVLVAWAVMLVLCVPTLSRVFKTHPLRVCAPLLVLVLALLPIQLRALEGRGEQLFQQKRGALALALNIRDAEAIRPLSADGRIFEIAKEAVGHQRSVFANDGMRGAAALLGQLDAPKTSMNQCQLAFDNMSAVWPQEGSEQAYVRIMGWAFQLPTKEVPTIVHVLDEQRRVVGYGLTGQPRPDVAAKVNIQSKQSGFVVYLMADHVGKNLIFRGLNPDCETVIGANWAQAPVPNPAPVAVGVNDVGDNTSTNNGTPSAALPYTVLDQAHAMSLRHQVVKQRTIVSSDWMGKDSYSLFTGEVFLPNLVVTGSYDAEQKDAATGTLTLHLKKGSKVWYRSDSETNKQKIIVQGETTFSDDAPFARNWVMLNFNHPDLKHEFDVSFVDTADGVGEWSAIGVRK